MGDGITYRCLGPGDLGLLLSVPEGLFDKPVDPDQVRAFLAGPGHLIVVAIDGEQVVGFASGSVLLHPDKQPSFLINEVGVREEWRRQGIGRAVCENLFDAARARGCSDGIWLGTEPDNVPALALYRALAGDEKLIVGFAWDGAFDDD